MGQCPTLLFCCYVKTLTKSNLREERIYWTYTSTIQSVFKRIQEMNSSRNTSLGKCCLLACFPLLTQPAFLYDLGPPVWVTYHTGSLTLSLIEKMHQRLANRPFWNSEFLKLVILFQDATSLCQIDLNSQAQPTTVTCALCAKTCAMWAMGGMRSVGVCLKTTSPQAVLTTEAYDTFPLRIQYVCWIYNLGTLRDQQ